MAGAALVTLEIRFTSLECLLRIAPDDPRVRVLAREAFLRTADNGQDPTYVLQKIAPLFRRQDPEFLELFFDLLPKLDPRQAAHLIEGLAGVLPPTPRAATGAAKAIEAFFFNPSVARTAGEPASRMDHPRLSHALGYLLARSCVPSHAEDNVKLIRGLLRQGAAWIPDREERMFQGRPASSRMAILATVARILVKQGPAAREALPELLALLDVPSPELQLWVAWTLWNLDPGNPRALAVLQSYADSASDMGIVLSLLDLATPEAKTFHALVRRSLNSLNETIRDAARQAARRSGISESTPAP